MVGESMGDALELALPGAQHRYNPLVHPIAQHAEISPRMAEDAAQLLLEQVGLIQRTILLHQLVEQQFVPLREVLPGREQQPLLDLEGPPELVASGTGEQAAPQVGERLVQDRKSTRLNSSHVAISYAVFCLKKKKKKQKHHGDYDSCQHSSDCPFILPY